MSPSESTTRDNPVFTVPGYAEAVQTSTPRPSAWEDVIGNRTAVEILREAIKAAKIQGRPLAHTLLFGPPGTGKSTLSKLVAQELGGGFIETSASTLETTVDVLRIIDQLNDLREATGVPTVLFLDEIHTLGQAKGRQSVDMEALYPLVEDWYFPHNMLGKTYTNYRGQVVYPKSSIDFAWPFTLVGATTEPGLLSQPLLRRFLLQIELQPYEEVEITQIIEGSAHRLTWAIDADAAAELAKYGRRNPGRAYSLLTMARNRAVATERETITLDVAQETIQRMRLYPLGLTDTDVRILKLLADRMPKGVGQTEICRAAGISQSQFTGMCEPYLRLLGFLETLSRRVIRPEGLVYLASLNAVDQNRPEVRAALTVNRAT